MKRITLLSLSAITIITLTTGCTNSTKNIEHSKHNNSHWSYKGDTGPKHWGSLNHKYSLCGKGTMQTPINIIPTNDVDLSPLEINYKTSSTDVINNGHTVQVNIAEGSSVTIDNEDYELKQFHFHTPSENNIKGNSYPLEAHFVHSTKDGKLAVIAVMFEEGKENPILKKIWDKFPLEENHKVSISLSSNDINSILPSNPDYYKFTGSLTTPPCSENVKWNVYKTTMSISKEQVEEFFNIFNHSNNRPLQKINDRVVFE